MTEYINIRLQRPVYDQLRKLEADEKRRSSITSSLEYLIRFHRFIKKADPDLYQKARFTIN